MKYGINFLRFRGAMLCYALNDDAKNIVSVAAFKKEIKTWMEPAAVVQFVNRRSISLI